MLETAPASWPRDGLARPTLRPLAGRWKRCARRMRSTTSRRLSRPTWPSRPHPARVGECFCGPCCSHPCTGDWKSGGRRPRGARHPGACDRPSPQHCGGALSTRDPQRAREAMDAHMQQTLDDLKTYVLARNPGLTPPARAPGGAQADNSGEREGRASRVRARSRLGSSCCMHCCRPVAMMEKPALSRALETAASCVTTLLQSRPSSIMRVTAASWPWASAKTVDDGLHVAGIEFHGWPPGVIGFLSMVYPPWYFTYPGWYRKETGRTRKSGGART